MPDFLVFEEETKPSGARKRRLTISPTPDWLIVALVGVGAILLLALSGRLSPEDVAKVLGWWLSR